MPTIDLNSLAVGDVVVLRKPHPCGGSRWDVTRTGTDIGLRCQTCDRTLMIDRVDLPTKAKLIRHTSRAAREVAPPKSTSADEFKGADVLQVTVAVDVGVVFFFDSSIRLGRARLEAGTRLIVELGHSTVSQLLLRPLEYERLEPLLVPGGIRTLEGFREYAIVGDESVIHTLVQVADSTRSE